MSRGTPVRDERTVAVENASYRWSYLVLSYGLLMSIAYRGFFRAESSWDLLALVIGGGVVSTLYRQNYRALPPKWVVVSAGAAVGALVLAAALRALR